MENKEAKMIVFENSDNKFVGINLNKVIEFKIVQCTEETDFWEFELLMDYPSYDDEDTTSVWHFITDETRKSVLDQITRLLPTTQ